MADTVAEILKDLHLSTMSQPYLLFMVEILQMSVDICLYNTATKTSSNYASFVKISKSGLR
jgi:hypothetical protein